MGVGVYYVKVNQNREFQETLQLSADLEPQLPPGRRVQGITQAAADRTTAKAAIRVD